MAHRRHARFWKVCGRMDEDFEIEVTDLRTGQVLKKAQDLPGYIWAPTPPNAPVYMPAAETQDRDFEVEISDLATGAGDAPALSKSLPSRKFPHGPGPTRRQVAGAAASGALVLVVLVALLSGVVSNGGIGLGLFPTPVPTATLTAGADTFYLVDTVPWGVIRVDSKPLTYVYSQQGPAFISLTRGQHSFEYDAAPFPTLKCVVSVPAAKSDSCPLYTPPDGSTNYGIPSTNRGIEAGSTLASLSPEEFNALVAVASQQFTTPLATTTVPAGDSYQGTGGAVLIAKTPLQAQAFYELNTDPAASTGANCVSLCDVQFGNGVPNSGSGWIIGANLAPIWRYIDATGTAIQLPAVPYVLSKLGGQALPTGAFTYISVNWNNGWQIAPNTAISNLGSGQQCFGSEAMFALAASLTFAGNSGYSSNEISAPNSADGCLMLFQELDTNGNTVGKPVAFLYRFGCIYAADAVAHAADPNVPLASGPEATLARQLLALMQSPHS